MKTKTYQIKAFFFKWLSKITETFWKIYTYKKFTENLTKEKITKSIKYQKWIKFKSFKTVSNFCSFELYCTQSSSISRFQKEIYYWIKENVQRASNANF